MKSFLRRGTPVATFRAGRRRRTFTASFMVASVAALSVSVAASASTAGSDIPTVSSAYNSAWQSAPYDYTAPSNDGLGVTPGSIGHVWVIVLENHAYQQSFTPLEGTQSSYLQDLPSQGALLTHYYGTGHSSLDNYVSLFSGQAPQQDDQSDCANYDAMDGTIDTSGTPATNSDFGQLESNAGPDAPGGDNGCVYPSSVSTIFNQLQNAGKSWKVYAEELGGAIPQSGGNTLQAPTPGDDQDAGYSSGSAYNYSDCGAPDASVAEAPDQAGSYSNPAAGAGSTVNTNAASTTGSVDSYVAKHNPLPWFGSILGTPDTTGGTIDSSLCTSSHLGSLFGPNDALYNDLQSTSTTPDLSVIIPDNCSDGHDALCAGNNLTGGTSNGYTNGTVNQALNNTGGTVAESAFLSIVVPEIEASPAFKQNGMILVTYDEAYPPFTYTGDDQATSLYQTADAAGSLSNDTPGETLFGRSLNWEPTGPNTTVVKSAVSGQVLSGGPGDMAYLDEPTASTATGDLVACKVSAGAADKTTPTLFDWDAFTTPTSTNDTCQPGAQASGYYPNTTSGSLKLDVTAGNTNGSTLESESGVTEYYDGAQVTAVAGTTLTSGNTSTYFTFPADGDTNTNVYIGQITNSPNAGDSTSAKTAYTSSVPFVDSLGNPVTATASAAGSQVAFTVSDKDSSDSAVTSNDPFFDPYDATLGGGDTGAVVISPYVKPGTVSNTYYNHYATLRTLEDIFGETSSGTNTLTGGIIPDSTTETTVGAGPYLGFASQPGLAPFGTDVFTDSPLDTTTDTVTNSTTVTNTVTTPVTVTSPASTVTTNTVSPAVTTSHTTTVTDVKSVVPYVDGYTSSRAKAAIRTDKLKVGEVHGSGDVVSISPRAGTEVKAGTKVSLTLKSS